MTLKKSLIAATLGAALSVNMAFAQDDDDLDVTIRLMPEGVELPDVVTAEIVLPTDDEGLPIPSAQGAENSTRGLETANAARENGRAFGEAAAAAALENRENLGNGSPPDLEDLIPGSPGMPDDLPGPPEDLPGPPEDLPGPPDV